MWLCCLPVNALNMSQFDGFDDEEDSGPEDEAPAAGPSRKAPEPGSKRKGPSGPSGPKKSEQNLLENLRCANSCAQKHHVWTSSTRWRRSRSAGRCWQIGSTGVIMFHVVITKGHTCVVSLSLLNRACRRGLFARLPPRRADQCRRGRIRASLRALGETLAHTRVVAVFCSSPASVFPIG